MRKTLRIALREYLAAVKTKGFIIGLVLAPLLMGGSIIAMALFKDQVDVNDKRVAVLDRTGTMSTALMDAAQKRNAKEVMNEKTGKKIKPAYLIEVVSPQPQNVDGQRLELCDRIRNGSLHGFLEIGADVPQPLTNASDNILHYYAKNAALDDMRQWLAGPVNDELRRQRLAAVGIDASKVKNLFDWKSVESMKLINKDAKTGEVSKAERRHEAEAVLVPMFMVILMFMLLMMGVAPMLQTVMEEKNQHIAEVMLSAVTPFQFMMGKLLGSVCVSLTGCVVYIFGGSFALTSMALTEYIPFGVLAWFFVYLILAIFMMGAMMAGLGSACNDAKDAQSLQLPVMLPMMIPMFMLMPVLKEPQSAFSTWLSLFPPFTPMLMILRQSAPGGIPVWQPWVGLIGLACFTLLAIWVGGRIFRVGILMQGKTPKLSEILRWAWRG